jgi:hypothetical protein
VFNPVRSGSLVFIPPWEDMHLTTWAAPTFTTHTQHVFGGWSTRCGSSTTQVKLCPYDEEDPDIWFHLIVAQFAAVGIKTQELKYANTLASLLKQVLRDILDTVDVCNGDQSFDLLKTVLLGQLGKSKWQSYHVLLRLPLEMQGLKPSILMGILKQHLPHGVSLDTDLFCQCFLFSCRLP